MPPLVLAALIGAGTAAATNISKGIMGAAQASKGRKASNKLMANQPTYKRPEEYQQELAMRKQMAAQGSMPGQGYIEQNIGGATSQALSAAEKGAISSNTYQKSVGDILSKQLSAFQDLGLQSAQWQQSQKENLMGTMQRGAGYSDQEWQTNKLQPWEIGMNQAESQRQMGAQGMFGALEGFSGNVMDYAGTSYMNKILGSQMNMGNSGAQTGQVKNPFQMSSVYGYDPQKNLLNTLTSMRK
jgi:hypothetical protein